MKKNADFPQKINLTENNCLNLNSLQQKQKPYNYKYFGQYSLI